MDHRDCALVTVHLVDYDLGLWVWVPHVWPHDGFATAEEWADASSRIVARRSGFRFLKRRALRDDLVNMASSRDGTTTNWTLAYAPDLSQVPRIARINAHDRLHGSYGSLEAFLQLDRPDLDEEPTIHSFTSPHLGRGITTLMRRTEPGGLTAVVRSYGWELDTTWLSLSVADFDQRYLARIRPDLDVLARAIAITETHPNAT